jgi:hypothetical protein
MNGISKIIDSKFWKWAFFALFFILTALYFLIFFSLSREYYNTGYSERILQLKIGYHYMMMICFFMVPSLSIFIKHKYFYRLLYIVIWFISFSLINFIYK